MVEFLKKVKQLPLTKMTSEQALTELDKLKREVAAKDNTYLRDVLARAT